MISSFTSKISSTIINCQQWAMIPEQKNKPYKANINTQENPYQQLKKLGQQANNIWQKHNKTPGQLAQLYADLFSNIDAQFLIELIDHILQSPDDLELIAQSSYRNITGFLKIVLTSSDTNSWKLRLHIWDQDGLEDLHNHKWDFFSKVIAGQILQDTYDIANNETDLCNAKKYSVREPVSLMPLLPDGQKPCPCKDRYSLHATPFNNTKNNFAYLYKSSCTPISAGCAYFMKHHIIHTIQPSKDAITFVFTSEQIEKNSQVFMLNSNTENQDAIERYAPSVTKEEVYETLLDVKKKLERAIYE